MTRVVSVGRSKGPLLLSALGITLLSAFVTGCPGTLDPSFTQGGTAGATGTAGTGAAGMPAAACDLTAVSALTGMDKYSCTQGGCHDNTGSAANLDMTSPGWETHLVGQVPKGGGALSKSDCANDAAFKTMPYIVAKSNPVDGLLIRKLSAATNAIVCSDPANTQQPKGTSMPPFPFPPVTPQDLDCFKSWATKLANP
jgi:hypothetical protein